MTDTSYASRFGQIRRFAGVGMLNTLADLGVYSALHSAGVPYITANLLSTSCGLALSFLLHSRYTFRSDFSSRRLLAFLLVTVTGLWLVQPLVIAAASDLLARSTDTPVLLTLLPKLAAIAITLVWNYIWYSLAIFKKPPAIMPPGSLR